MNECIGCKHCIYEHGQCVECQCDNLTEEEITRYWEDGEKGCPHFVKADGE